MQGLSRITWLVFSSAAGLCGAVWGMFFGESTVRSAMPYVVAEKFPENSRFVEKKGRRKVLVFVHGVTGTATNTWRHTAGGQTTDWPVLVAREPRLQDHDVYVASYYSPRVRKAPSIYELAKALRADLERDGILPTDREPGRYDEVVFICHSMGNLVVRTALMTKTFTTAEPPHKPIANPVSLILSVAAPSGGSSLAAIAQKVSLNEQFKDMAQIEHLQFLNTMWHQRGFDTEIACAYEENDYNFGVVQQKIVEKESATALCTRPEHQGIRENHISIVKPDGDRHAVHQWLIREVTRPQRQRGWELERWTRNEIIVAAKDHAESNLNAAMIALVLDAELPGVKVRRDYNRGHASRIYSDLKDRQIDIYPEYDGSLLYQYLGKDPLILKQTRDDKGRFGPALVNQELERNSQTIGMKYLPHLGFHNPYVLVMLYSQALRHDLLQPDGTVLLSDLARLSRPPHSKSVIFKADQEFRYRRDGFLGLVDAYGMNVADFDYVKHKDIYQELARNSGRDEIIVTVGYGTDVRLNLQPSLDLIRIRDDRGFFPHYHPGPLLDRFLVKRFPDIETALARLADKVTFDDMTALLHEADRRRAEMEPGLREEERWRQLEPLVQAFLREKGVLKR